MKHLEWLKVNGTRIKEESDKGNVQATRIIDVYTMYHRRPDPIVEALLTVACEDFQISEFRKVMDATEAMRAWEKLMGAAENDAAKELGEKK